MRPAEISGTTPSTFYDDSRDKFALANSADKLLLNNESSIQLRIAGTTNVMTVSDNAVDVIGDLHASGTSTSSDDRLKWNETPITNGLETIRQLQPQTYDKALLIPHDGLQPEETRREAGLIAQEVLAIPDLAQFVKAGSLSYSLDYNSIFTHMVAALKELDELVQTQQRRIEILESK